MKINEKSIFTSNDQIKFEHKYLKECLKEGQSNIAQYKL